MFDTSIFKGTDKALNWFESEGTIYFALYQGVSKDPILQNLKGKYEDMEECKEKIKNYFNFITTGPKTIYILKWWEEKPEVIKGKVSPSDGSIKFITSSEEEVNEYRNEYRERVGSYNNAILSRLEAIEQKISKEDEEEEEDQPQNFGLSGIVNNPQFQTMVVEYIGAIVDKVIPIKRQSVAINGFDDNKLETALSILKKHDPELESDLTILADMAENNPSQFKFLLSMLRK